MESVSHQQAAKTGPKEKAPNPYPLLKQPHPFPLWKGRAIKTSKAIHMFREGKQFSQICDSLELRPVHLQFNVSNYGVQCLDFLTVKGLEKEQAFIAFAENKLIQQALSTNSYKHALKTMKTAGDVIKKVIANNDYRNTVPKIAKELRLSRDVLTHNITILVRAAVSYLDDRGVATVTLHDAMAFLGTGKSPQEALELAQQRQEQVAAKKEVDRVRAINRLYKPGIIVHV